MVRQDGGAEGDENEKVVTQEPLTRDVYHHCMNGRGTEEMDVLPQCLTNHHKLAAQYFEHVLAHVCYVSVLVSHGTSSDFQNWADHYLNSTHTDASIQLPDRKLTSTNHIHLESMTAESDTGRLNARKEIVTLNETKFNAEEESNETKFDGELHAEAHDHNNRKAANGEEFDIAVSTHAAELEATDDLMEIKFDTQPVVRTEVHNCNGMCERKAANCEVFEVVMDDSSNCTAELETSKEIELDTQAVMQAEVLNCNDAILLCHRKAPICKKYEVVVVDPSTHTNSFEIRKESKEIEFDCKVHYSCSNTLPDRNLSSSKIKLNSETDFIDPVEETQAHHYDSLYCSNLSNDYFRGDRPSTKADSNDCFQSLREKQYNWPENVRPFDNPYDGANHNETTVASSSGYYTGNSNYSNDSYRAKIVVGSSKRDSDLVPTYHDRHGTNLCGIDSESDNACKRIVNHKPQRLAHNHDLQKQTKHNDLFYEVTPNNTNAGLFRNPHAKGIAHDQLKCPETLCGIYSESDKADNKVPINHEQRLAYNHESHRQTKQIHEVVAKNINAEALKKQGPQGIVDDSLKYSETSTAAKPFGYNKMTYPVLVGNSVRVYSTQMFAALPYHDKFMVKERQKDSTGSIRVKLALKSSARSSSIEEPQLVPSLDNKDVEKDGTDDSYSKVAHFRENCKSSGYVICTRDKRFRGNIKYPLPSGRATDSKIGKGGNGFVFTIYHEGKQYAVKKTVYRSNEVSVHSSLNHKNVLPLAAVLMGEKHERHSGRFYCFHFMPMMSCDLRQILSTREVGCLKHFYNNCSNKIEKWQTGFGNIKFILGEILEALAYLHNNGYVHRDVKASNVMIKTRNQQCQPLTCNCASKFQVKLGDFDSAGTVPGLGIKEPTDQMIKFASILPLGTPGYRAPEVSMHTTLSGPYETLYTFAVDMWSFGCLCLNICIGKTAALKQREEAALLLSRTHPCSVELWEKTTKIKELENAAPFVNEKDLINLIRGCLKVTSAERPSALEAIDVFKHKILASKFNQSPPLKSFTCIQDPV